MLRAFLILLIALATGAAPAPAEVDVQGGGATFPNPLYQRWIKDFNAAHDSLRIAYAARGSGAGIGGLLDKTLNFVGSDAPMNDDELAKAKAAGGDVIQIPATAGAVVLAYNLPNLNANLQLSGSVLADIYLGKIAQWDDPAIAALNPALPLPDLPITSVHRGDGSGTTFVFTSYLCTQSDEFETRVYFGKAVRWPDGQGGQGNAGVAQAVQQTLGAIGYLELNFAVANRIPFALIENNNGKFVKASPQSVSAAGEAALPDMDADQTLAVRLWSRPGDDVYPISSFSYLYCYRDLGYLKDRAKAQAIADFFAYAARQGQQQAAELSYAPLSPGVARRVRRAIAALTFNGRPLRPSRPGDSP